MTTKEEQNLLDHFVELPEILQTAVLSPVTEEYVISVVRKYNVSAKDVPILLDEVSFVLLGAVNPKDFSYNLVKSGFSVDLAPQVSSDIEKEIFNPLGETLSTLFEEESDSSSTKNIGEIRKPQPGIETKENILDKIEKSFLPNISFTPKTIFEQKLSQNIKIPQTKEEMLAELKRPEGEDIIMPVGIPNAPSPITPPTPQTPPQKREPQKPAYDLFPNPQKNPQVEPPHGEKKDPYREPSQ